MTREANGGKKSREGKRKEQNQGMIEGSQAKKEVSKQGRNEGSTEGGKEVCE